MPKFLVDGAELKCTMGATSGSFKVLSPKVKGCKKPMGNKLDCIPMVNIPSFGTCKAIPAPTPPPCIPVTTPWDTSSNVKVRGAPAITESSCTMCALGGKISVSSPGQSKIDNVGGGASAEAAADEQAAATEESAAAQAANKDAEKPKGKEKFNKRKLQKQRKTENKAKGGAQYKGTSGNNRAQNSQAKAAYQREIGNKPAEKHQQRQWHKKKREFHDEVTRQNKDFEGLRESARYVKGDNN